MNCFDNSSSPASTPATRSRPPRRAAATHGLDKIALQLQRAGLLNFRQARRAVWAVRDLWKAAIADGQAVETPAGSFVGQEDSFPLALCFRGLTRPVFRRAR